MLFAWIRTATLLIFEADDRAAAEASKRDRLTR